MPVVYSSSVVPPVRAEVPLLNSTLGWSALAIGLERFSYYGMRTLLLLYLINGLERTSEQAASLYSNSNALLYLTPLLGGWLADRFWGIRRARLVGAGLVLLGHLLLLSGVWLQPVLSASLFDGLFCGGLTLLMMGNGVLAPALYVGVGRAYPARSRRLVPAFLLMTLTVSGGAFMAPMICGSLGDTGNPAGFRWGFLAAAVGAALLLAVVVVLSRRPAAEEPTEPVEPLRLAMGLLLMLLAAGGGTAWLVLELNSAWLIAAGLMACLTAVLLVAVQATRFPAAQPVAVAGLAAVGALATVFMVAWDGLQRTAQEGQLPLALVILGPLVGAALLWLWAGRNRAPGEQLISRLSTVGLALMGIALLVWVVPVALHLASGGESGLWAGRWLITGGAVFLLALGKQCLDLVLPAIVSNPPIGRYVAFAMGLTFALSRVGQVAGDVLQELLASFMQ